MDKVAKLVKIARSMTSEERNREARARYRAGGIQERRKRKIKQRVYRKRGGQALKNKVKIQQRKLKYKPTRIRKEPLQKRPRDMS